MLQSIPDGYSLFGILLQESLDKFDALRRYLLFKRLVREVGVLRLDLVEGLLAVMRLEWEILADHRVQDDTARPKVYLAAVALLY